MGHYFYVSYWRLDRHFTWSSQLREGLAICKAEAIPSFLSHFKTLSVVRSLKSNPRPPAHQSSALPTELILLQIYEGSRNSSWSFTRATYLGRLLKLLAKRRLT